MQPEGLFSSGLRLTVLNDFLKPEEACSKPSSFGNKTNESVSVGVGSDSNMLIEYDGAEPIPIRNQTQAVAKITLSDCLACSGCITSSEVIFLETQSITEFSRQLLDKTKTVVVSINQQSLSSIAVNFKLTPEQTFAKLRTFFQSIGVCDVYSLSCVRDVSLIEVAKEFVERKKRSIEGDKLSLPMLLGYCPGWVCYAEKTGDDSLLGHISTTKSSQQLMGNYIKTAYAQQRKLDPSTIYHASIAPCYDKKLEAVRDTISNPTEVGLSEVDIVLTTSEVVGLLNEHNINFENMSETYEEGYDSIFTRISEKNYGSSHGFSDMALRYAAKEFWGVDLEMNNISFEKGKNNEIWELEFSVNGIVVMTVARAYGFRNIQNVMRSIKRKNCKYDFVELLACPGGCSNGGGQIKAATSENPKELLLKVNEVYNSESTPVLDPMKNPFVVEYYTKFLSPNKEQQHKQLHTSYKVLVRESSSLSSVKISW